MTIEAESADGVVHEFPDGTDRAVIDRVMKDYAQSRLSGTATGKIAARGPIGDALGYMGVPFLSTPDEQAAYAERQMPAPGAGAKNLRNAEGRVATVLRDAPLGFGDEIAGVFSSDARDTMRRSADAYAAENPLSSFALSALAATPAAVAATPRALLGATAPAARYTSAAAIGAGFGGLMGFGSGQDGLENRMDSAATGATVGAAFGVGMESLLSGLVRVWRAAGAPRMTDSVGNPTAEAQAMAREAGIDLAVVPAGILARMDAVARRGGGPGVPGTTALVEAESLPVPVHLRRSQATGDNAALAAERGMARGDRGEPAMRLMQTLNDEQAAQLAANIPAIRERIASGNPVVERDAAGRLVSGEVNSLYDAAKGRAGALYDDARRLDEASAPLRKPMSPATDADLRMAPPVEGYVPEAAAAVRYGRAPLNRPEPGIINTIQRMGGVKVLDAEGRLTSEGGDLRAIFDGRYPPGFINNKSGKPLDYIRESLAEQGWFPGRDPQDVSLSEVLDLIGGRARHPLSVQGRDRGARESIRSDMKDLGITRRMSIDTAAGRLAIAADAEARGTTASFGEKPLPAGGAVRFDDAAGNDVASRMFTVVERDHGRRNVPKTWREIGIIGKDADGGNLSPRLLYEARERLNNIRRDGGNEAVAAGKAIREMDAAIDDAMRNSLLSGDEEAIQAFKLANSTYKEFKQQFGQDDMIGALVERDYRNNGRLKVAPEEAMNYIFGRADLGFVGARDMIRDLARLRDLLGADSAAWNAMQQEAFNRFANRALGDMTPNGRNLSGQKFAKAWDDANANYGPLLRLIFNDPAIRRDIGNFANTLRRVTTEPTAVRAPSVSPLSLRRIMGWAAGRIPYLGRWLDDQIVNVAGWRAAQQADRAKLGDAARVSDRETSALVGAGAAALGAQR